MQHVMDMPLMAHFGAQTCPTTPFGPKWRQYKAKVALKSQSCDNINLPIFIIQKFAIPNSSTIFLFRLTDIGTNEIVSVV